MHRSPEMFNSFDLSIFIKHFRRFLGYVTALYRDSEFLSADLQIASGRVSHYIIYASKCLCSFTSSMNY